MITGLYTAALAIILIGLIVGIVMRRYKYKVGLGDGGIKPLSQAIRAHGNFIEVVPFLLIEMYILENKGWEDWALHVFGITLVLSRLAHAWGLYHNTQISWGRTGGTIVTLLLLLIGAIGLLVQFIS